MNKSIVIGSTLAVLGLGGLAVGAYQVQTFERAPTYADILSVDAVTRSIETPREVCEDVVVYQQAPSRDPNRLLGTAAGAVVGGVLGNQIGGGSGKKLATVAGAVGGGFAGREVQGRVEANQGQAVTQRQCNTVVDTHQQHEGYDVEYRFEDRVYSVRLDESPRGDRVLMEGGVPQWNVREG